MTTGWYNLAKNSEFLHKESDFNGIRKGLGMGMGLGAIPMGLALLTNPSAPAQQPNPQKTTIQAPQQKEQVQPSPVAKPIAKQEAAPQSGLPSMQEIKSFIAPFEGTRSKVYKDSKGFNTIGIGFNLDTPSATAVLATIGTSRKEILSGKELSTEQIDKLFAATAKTAIKDAQEWMPNLSSLPKNVQLVVIDLSFNMGGPVLRTFKQTQSFLAKKDFASAASGLEKSKWYGQVKNRAKHHVTVLREAAKQAPASKAESQTVSSQPLQQQPRP